MVKKLIICIVLLVSLLGFCSWEQHYIDSTLDKMLEHIRVVQASVESNETDLYNYDTMLHFDKMQKYWESREATMSMFIDHKNLSQIGQGISRLKASLEENDYTLSITEVYLLQEVTFVCQRISTFNLHNIIWKICAKLKKMSKM